VSLRKIRITSMYLFNTDCSSSWKRAMVVITPGSSSYNTGRLYPGKWPIIIALRFAFKRKAKGWHRSARDDRIAPASRASGETPRRLTSRHNAVAHSATCQRPKTHRPRPVKTWHHSSPFLRSISLCRCCPLCTASENPRSTASSFQVTHATWTAQTFRAGTAHRGAKH